jgi:hypothetical protein
MSIKKYLALEIVLLGISFLTSSISLIVILVPVFWTINLYFLIKYKKYLQIKWQMVSVCLLQTILTLPLLIIIYFSLITPYNRIECDRFNRASLFFNNIGISTPSVSCGEAPIPPSY